MTGATNATNLFDLTGKVAVVTGSTKGIGRAIALGLSQAGATVVVSSRKQALCDQVAAEISDATGNRTLALACHVGEWAAVPEFIDAVHHQLGSIDVLVNNAGISPASVGISDMTIELWRKVFSVNIEGPLRTSQCVAPLMRDNGGGSIVNIVTMGAYSGGHGVGAYGASKAGLINLTKTMAQEWAPWKVRVNALSPGPFLTDMVEGGAKNSPGFLERLENATFLHRIADPSEIVGPVLYLASDASSYVTGDDICVAGGMHR